MLIRYLTSLCDDPGPDHRGEDASLLLQCTRHTILPRRKRKKRKPMFLSDELMGMKDLERLARSAFSAVSSFCFPSQEATIIHGEEEEGAMTVLTPIAPLSKETEEPTTTPTTMTCLPALATKCNHGSTCGPLPSLTKLTTSPLIVLPPAQLPKLKISLLQASPLVRRDCSRDPPQSPTNSSQISMAAWDTAQEKATISKLCQEAHLLSNHLTIRSLGQALTVDCPDILHLSAHGQLETDHTYSLAFEHPDLAHAEFFTMPQLETLASAAPRLPQLVFVAACHSTHAGDVLIRAGVEHVIVTDGQVLDSAAQIFTHFFYAALFGGHNTIQQAFDVATANVRISPRCAINATQFLLLPRCGVHDVTIQKVHRNVSRKDNAAAQCPPKSPIPSRHEHVIGRAVHVQKTIGQMFHHRYVNICGPKAYGKSTVCVEVVHWLHDRSHFKDGIVFLDMERVGDDVAFFVAQLALSLGIPAYQELPLSKWLQFLEHKHVLVVMDNVRSDGGAGKCFAQQIALQLLRHTHAVRIILASTAPLTIQSSCGLVYIGELSINDSLRLLHCLAPWLLADPHQAQAIVQHAKHSPSAIRQYVHHYLKTSFV